MSELQQLKDRIINSNYKGLETAFIRDDYMPAGDMMIKTLVDSSEFITRKVEISNKNYWKIETCWKIFKTEFKPY